MFERYTEKARRVIFFARYEASQFGAPAIEPEHLLLGLMREDKTLTGRFFPRAQVSIESIRKEIEGRTLLREKISTSVELPLAPETKHVLAYAHEESDRLQHRHIGTEHLNRYCDEFAFRYSHRQISDGARAELIYKGSEGKRLTYKQPAGTSEGRA